MIHESEVPTAYPQSPDAAITRRKVIIAGAVLFGAASASFPLQGIEALQRRISQSDTFYSLHNAESGFAELHPSEKRDVMGELQFKDLDHTIDPISERDGMYEMRFNVEDVSTPPCLAIQTIGDPEGSLVWIQGVIQNIYITGLTKGENLTYNIPILRTPNHAEQTVVLKYAKPGDNSIRFYTTPASGDLNADNVSIRPQVLKDPTPMQCILLAITPTVAVQASNFINYYMEGASDEDKYDALMNDTAFFNNLRVLKSSNEWLIEVMKGDDAEVRGTSPIRLNQKYKRMYDVDQSLFAYITQDYKIRKLSGQKDELEKAHQVTTLKEFSQPVESDDPQLRELTFLHAVEGHGMTEPGIEEVIVNGETVPVTDVVSILPTIVSTTEDKSDKAKEIELVKRLVAVMENQRKVYQYFDHASSPSTSESLDMYARLDYLQDEERTIRDEIARIVA